MRNMTADAPELRLAVYLGRLPSFRECAPEEIARTAAMVAGPRGRGRIGELPPPALEVRLAARLSREFAARYMTIQEIAGDALGIANAAKRVGAKVKKSAKHECELPALRELLQRYDATLVENRRAHGTTVAVRFSSAYRDVVSLA